MKTNNLNLADPKKSQISYKIINFPDGQRDILINKGTMEYDQVSIYSRFNSFRDLELIMAAKAALDRLEIKRIYLHVPYLLGARSDRYTAFGDEAGTSYLVDVIAPVLNLMNFNKIYCYDVHQPDVAAACIKNLYSLVPHDLYNFLNREKNCVIVCPDAGAMKKIFTISQQSRKDMITCTKHRDTRTGQITRTEVPEVSEFVSKYIIIDDICDGGRTFIEIAKVIRDRVVKGPLPEIELVVTHGIFSATISALTPYFNKIRTTNSVQPWESRKDDEMELIITPII